MKNKIKCYSITPSSDRHYDELILLAGDTWKPILNNIEDVLDSLYLKQDDPDNLDWENIKLTIKCKYFSLDDLIDKGFSREQLKDYLD